MAPMTPAERQRRYRENLKIRDPEKYERMKKENAERTKKKYIQIKQLPGILQNQKRKNWREQKKKLKKNLTFIEINEKDRSTQKQKRKVRYLLSEEKFALKARVANMSKIIKRQRKTLCRYKKKMANLQQSLKKLEKEFEDIRKSNGNVAIETKEATPYSKTERLIHETMPNIPTPDKNRVKKAIFEGYVLKESLSSQYANTKSKFDKSVIQKVINNDIVKKYKLKTAFGNSCLGLKGRLRQRKKGLERKKMRRIKEIQHFLERDDNSRITAGKRETRTLKKDKKQVRYLLDSMDKLHKKYKEEGGLASYTVFTRYKPFYILDPKLTQRNTCACVKHANLLFLAQKLKILGVLETDDLDRLVSGVVCDKFNEKCMYNECKSCENKTVLFNLTRKSKTMIVSWNAWVSKTHEYVKSNSDQDNVLKTKRTTKDVIEGTLESLIKSFTDQLGKFKKHYFNIYHAYQMYKKCKENLTETECIIHCDFSENYNCKSNEEVQAMHFGASKIQFTLHTGVIYYKNGQHLQEKSFCTISPCNNHGPIAIWAHLKPILEYIKKTVPNVTTLHFFSDGPTTQYRQKGNFYLMSEMIKQLTFQQSTWSFFESAHGKGAADGIGGAVKRNLDKQVTFGKDIVDAQTAYDILRKCQSKIMYFYVTEENIKDVEKNIDLAGLIPVPRTMEIHQIITTDQVHVIQFRKLACFCKEPLCECFGLEEHNLKTKSQKRKHEEKRELPSNNMKRKCIEKSRKRITKRRDTDTSIESHITYADSDDSVWKPDEEYNSDDNYDDTQSNENNFMVNTAKNINKKVTVLSELKNSPDNLRYFDLKNYGPLTLSKVNMIQEKKINVNKKLEDNREEMEGQNENNLSISIRKESALEEKEIILGEEQNVMTVHDIEEYKLKQNTKKDTEKFCEIPTIILAVEQKCSNNEIKMHTEINPKHTKEDPIGENKIETKEKNDSEVDMAIKTDLEEYNLALSENVTEEPPNMIEETEHIKYNINDSVLVRYYQKKSWVYYIGFIEDVDVEENLTYYAVKFLKTVKKPNLKFVTPKKVDKDIVPSECVVKHINLELVANGFVIRDNDDHIYFS